MTEQIAADSYMRFEYNVQVTVHIQIKNAGITVEGKKVVFVEVTAGVANLSQQFGIPADKLGSQILLTAADLVGQHLGIQRDRLEVVRDLSTPSHIVIAISE